jgi:hypothetical protein
MKISISQVTQVLEENMVTLSCDVSNMKGKSEKLIYKITTSHNDFIAPNNADWVLIGLIYPAMVKGLPLNIKAPISHDLLFFAQHDLQVLLLSINKNLKKIKITAEIIDSSAKLVKDVGTATGFSAGIDTFATLILNLKSNIPCKITDLTIFNVGAFGKEKSTSQREILNRNFTRLKKFSESIDTNWFLVDTNLEDFYSNLHRSGFQKTATLRNVSAALTLQSKIDNYLYSSTFPYSAVSSVKTKSTYPNIDMGYIDPIILPILSNKNMSFLSYGANYSRFEKVELVSKFKDAYEYLDVCTAKPIHRTQKINCSSCKKCMKTMLTLEILGKLNKFSKVFDLKEYEKNRRGYIKSLGAEKLLGTNSINDLVKTLKKSSLYVRPSLLDYLKVLKSYIKQNTQI